MLLNVIGRPGDAFAAMRHLLTDNHEEPAAQRRHIRRAIAIYRALLAGGWSSGCRAGRRRPVGAAHRRPAVRLRAQPAAVAVRAGRLELLDRESPAYPLDVVSVIESTLDDPRQVLSAQQFKARGEAVAAMKAEGIEYEAADGTAGRRHLPAAAGWSCWTRRTRRTGSGHPWVADYELTPSASSGTCTSGR